MATVGIYDNFKYRECKDYIKILEYIGKDEEELIIPEVINGKNVTCSESYFIGCNETLKRMFLPKFFEKISIGTFCSTDSIEEFIVDQDNKYFTSIDGVLFNKNITDLILYPRSKKDSKYIVPNTVLMVESYAFSSNDYLEEVVFPENLAYMGSSIFHGCKNLKKINIPCKIDFISTNLFGCSGIEKIHIPSNVKIIGKEAFQLSELKEITFDEGLKEIRDNAFATCTNLMSIALPNSLKEIGPRAFRECYKLKNITLPSTIEYIGEDAFKEVPVSKDGLGIDVIYNNNDTILKSVVNTKLKKLVIPDTVKIISQNAFHECMDLEEITFPKSIKCIDEDVFNLEYLNAWGRRIVFSLEKINIKDGDNVETIHYPNFSKIPSYLAIGFLECIKVTANGDFFDYELYDSLFTYIRDDNFKKMMAESRLNCNSKLGNDARQAYLDYLCRG